ncbi:phosphate/sulfate permease [Xylanibacter oryzae DSM 17970]|uniref:Phosphate transporter n=1 Tax=Xylanibacter oryzae DSM 17970 TaxID=915438 RepID=A0ABN0RUC5_9BACT|nr:inorganic phosphate transporter [Xylanibacter oryzae]EXG77808.1 phosphate/sulfate permease [Xylanibacter oryzae DSM 17970]
MESIYLVIVVFLLILAVFDLFVGVSNDAVNFLNSAIGAKVAKFRTVLIVASFGVVIGAVMSAGMMDVARHGIINPSNFSFNECMTIFLAVMITDVIVLDVFNTLGLPTSTTVSLVFELLGGTFVLALLKMGANPNLGFNDLLNSDKALSVIIAIFVSVAIAFFFGTIVQWISRLIFTFNYTKHLRYTVAVFGAIAFTTLAYFIFIQGLAKSPYISEFYKQWIKNNTTVIMLGIFLGSSIFVEVLHLLKVNVFKIIVLVGTFALAMAFSGNDLVNFIGVPLAGLSSFQDFIANGLGHDKTFMMTSLMESAKTPAPYLMMAGIIMIISMATSKKAQNVVKTSVDLSRQDEGEEMFGSSRAARSIVRAAQDIGESVAGVIPKKAQDWIESRFNKDDAIIAHGAAFDMIRAAVNLVLSSILIIIGTNYKMPLSTTYVTFMVAMGASLADHAWSRESAVFRVTGVISVIGGWFITAGVAFAICAIVCILMHFGGFVAMFLFMALDVFLLLHSNIKYGKKVKEEKKDDIFRLMMRTRDPEIVWDLLTKYVSRTQSFVARFALDQYNSILGGLRDENLRDLRRCSRELKDERDKLKKFRRKELLALRRTPKKIALERNTWFHLGANSDQQFIYCLTRMLEPVKEHIDNNFTPLPIEYSEEFEPIRREIEGLMKNSEHMISTNRYDQYDQVLAEADNLKNQMSALRKHHIDRMQNDGDDSKLEVSLVYLNILQESQEFLSIMRHQLRAAKKFMEK